MPMRIRAKGYSMAWKLPGNSNKPERIKSEAISTLPEPALGWESVNPELSVPPPIPDEA